MIFFGKKLDKKGIATVELALFFPIAFVILYMMLDLTALFKMRYKVDNLSAIVAQMTIGPINNHQLITYDDLYKTAQTASFSFQGGSKTHANYDFYIAWELVSLNSAGQYDVEWSAYAKQIEGENVSLVNSDVDSSNLWGGYKKSSINTAKTEITDYSSSNVFNLGSRDKAVIVTVVCKQNSSDSFYDVSPFTYKIIKDYLPDFLYSISAVILPEGSYFPPQI